MEVMWNQNRWLSSVVFSYVISLKLKRRKCISTKGIQTKVCRLSYYWCKDISISFFFFINFFFLALMSYHPVNNRTEWHRSMSGLYHYLPRIWDIFFFPVYLFSLSAWYRQGQTSYFTMFLVLANALGHSHLDLIVSLFVEILFKLEIILS